MEKMDLSMVVFTVSAIIFAARHSCPELRKVRSKNGWATLIRRWSNIIGILKMKTVNAK